MEKQALSVPALVARVADAGAKTTPRTVARWRAGTSAPGVEALPFIATALGVTTDYLLGVEA